MTTSPIIFFGCIYQAGHHFYASVDKRCAKIGWSREGSAEMPFSASDVDQPFCPKGRQDQGRAKISFFPKNNIEWTALAWWDRSGPDDRYGSHSTFLWQGVHSFDEFWQQIQADYPQIASRQPHAPFAVE